MEIPWVDISVLLITTLVSLIAFIKWQYKYWERRNIPYIKPSFPMGNFENPWAIKSGFHYTVFDIHRQIRAKGHKYGGMFSSLRPIFVPVDLDLLKSIIIKDFQYFVDRGVYYNSETDPLSGHLFNIEGKKWRSLRTRLSPAFSSGKQKYMFQTILDCAKALEPEIEKLYIKKEPVDIKEVVARYTTNVIGSCAFGLDCDAFGDPDNEFRRHARKFFDGGNERALRNIVTLSYPELCGKLGVTFFPRYLTQFYYNVIKNVTELRESSSVKRNDLVQLLLDIKNGAVKAEDSFTFDEIAAQAFIFFLAGFETSSATMAFAFYEIAKNQEVQDKIREEVRNVLDKHHGQLTYEAMTDMTYMSQVFDETLRKYPIMGTLDRIVTKDYKIPGEDFVLKKGTKLLISLVAVQNDPEFFPDPDKFDPERFSPENKLNRHICAYMPFGEGPRICLGMRLAINQAKIAIAKLLTNYRYRLNSKMPEMRLHTKAPLIRPEGDIMLDIEKIE